MSEKFQGSMTIQLAEIQLPKSVAACGNNDQRFYHNKPEGFRITDIGRGVLCEAPNQADVLLYPAILKRAVALKDIELPGTKAPQPVKQGVLSLEDLLTSEAGFGLKTATSLQRAICRAIEGRPLDDLWLDPAVRRSFGE